jgi:hypothetical protein
MDNMITVKSLIEILKKFDESDKVFLSDPGGLYVNSIITNKSTWIIEVKQY